MFDSLDAVWTHAWARLLSGARGRDDPFHQGVLANAAEAGPQARYAVLRAVDPDAATVAFHTDRRSPKLAQLQADPRLAWCFFGHREQLRLQGRVVLHLDDAEADAAWAACGRAARATYAVPLAPGTALADPADGDRPTTADAASLTAARGHFALVRLHLDALDWLSLAASGHRRAGFRPEHGRWQGSWLSP
ncbi:pyridoxamine 5'-phosphate oxidase family protein [Arenimonas alkanexedens]